MLERTACKDAAFVTLTYNPEHLPPNNSLSKEHWREFTKGIGYRYFGCGEYGNKFGRPHYHLVLFGIDALQAEQLAVARWPYGFVHSRPFVAEHAAYVAAYTVKKLTKVDDSRLAPGQIPEFALMSRRPGVGVPGLDSFVRWFHGRGGAAYVAVHRDVPSSVRINGRISPLGRTLRRHFRDGVDVPHDDPVRNRMRDLAYRSRVVEPNREARRVSQYERAKAVARRSSGSL